MESAVRKVKVGMTSARTTIVKRTSWEAHLALGDAEDLGSNGQTSISCCIVRLGICGTGGCDRHVRE